MSFAENQMNKGSKSWKGEAQREQKSSIRSVLGLEMNTELVWEDWDPEKEFTKTLVVKNIHGKPQKLHLRPPVSKFFTTLTPQSILLSPGILFSVPVIFKPLLRCEYEDSIEFQGKNGSVQVFLRATVPCHALEVPDSVLLPVCAVEHSTQTTFCLKNTSNLQTWFQWVCEGPFQMSPEKGLLKQKQECHITVLFEPLEALVYQQHATCSFGEEDSKDGCRTVLLKGIAKYPCLQLRSDSTNETREKGSHVLQFGSVPVGKSLQKRFDIFNPSPVTASFSLSRISGGVPLLGSEFRCDVTVGKVAPGKSHKVTVTYSPAVVDTVYVENLTVKCKGALNKPQLKLIGTCKGPRVSLSSSVVDFGCLDEGEAVLKTVDLINSSPVVAFYQWDLDSNGHSVFSIKPASGSVSPHSHITLKATYRPTQPIAHHRRVACLVLHQEPLFLDLIGTCHSEQHQPAILRPEHLVLYKLLWQRQDPPDAPNPLQVQADQLEISSHTLQEISSHTLQEIFPFFQSNQTDSSAAAAALPISPMEEFFQSCSGLMHCPSSSSSESHSYICVEPSQLLFNFNKPSSGSSSSASSQTVSITNQTRRKVSLVWTVALDSSFTVSPATCDLAPLKSTSFQVMYEPKQLNTLHGAQLECFAFNRESQPIADKLLCLPWCVTVRVIAHSFQLGKEHFIPRCSLTPARVVFPAVSALSYRTVLLQNTGDLPLTFCLDQSSSQAMVETVFLFPHCGFIQPGHHQILNLRAIPTEDSPEEGFSLQLQLNAAKHTKELTVVSVVEKPCLSLEGDSTLYFMPTAVGSQTQRSKRIRNLSRLSLRFQWSIPESGQGIIFVEPDVGELHPNESSVQTWYFSPLEEKTYRVKANLMFWPIQIDGDDKSQLTLEVKGVGSIGFIKAEKALVDVGETLIGSYRSFDIPLVNNSPCTVTFSLSVQQQLLEKVPIKDPGTEPSALELDFIRGTIPSQCKLLLRSTVRPKRRAQYLWTINYQTINSSGFVSSTPQALCEVRTQGVFPTLQVIDVCSSGNVGRLGKEHLRKLFSLEGLNENLLSNPCPSEFIYKAPTSSHNYPIFTKSTLDFNFSAAPLNSEPSTFVLMFHNPGSIPVDWAFLFPEDEQIELEYWAHRRHETQEYKGTDLCHKQIRDNQLFSITPYSGTLHPDQQRAVHFTYRHKFVGTDRIPVVLKLYNGKEILLNFQGVTFERDRPYLHFDSSRHVFSSVSIRDFFPPRQVFELYNVSDVPVHYEVDTAALSQLQEENFNHPVLRCLNLEGEVLPGKVAMLEWIFSPLELKTYIVDVPIHLQGGDTALMRFEGCGSDTLKLKSSNSSKCNDSKTSIPCVQRLSLPEQVVVLSEDRISLGDIPVSSQCSRILFITNKSPTDTFLYSWELPEQSNQQLVQIHPDQGSLCPGESHHCVLSFTSAIYPMIYQLDLICQVNQKAAVVQYSEDLQFWEEEIKRQQEEFTITDIGPSNKECVSPRGQPFRKYKPLPPICSSSSSNEVGQTSHRARKSVQWALRETIKQPWRQPEPPQPSLLHLGVTAHSHGPHYRSLLSDVTQNLKPNFPATTMPQPTQAPPKDIIVNILMSLLKNILDDPAFIQSVVSEVSKPATYQRTQPPHYPSVPSSPDISTCPTSTRAKPEPEVVSSSAEGTVENQPQTQDIQYLNQNEPVYMAEKVLLNILQDLMVEAVSGELVLTTHPRSVVLPPVSASKKEDFQRCGMAEESELKRETVGIEFGD